MSYLICLHGQDHGKEWNLPAAGKLKVGRSPDNQVIVHDNKVSRHHCQVAVSSDAIVLENLESRNGTVVHGKPVSASLLHFDQIIQIGDSIFTVSRQKLRSRVAEILGIPEPEVGVFVSDQADVLFNVIARDEGHATKFTLN